MEASKPFEVTAKLRTEHGTGANRRLRRTGHIPAILYGAGKETTPLTLIRNEFDKHLKNQAFYSKILTITIDGQVEQAVLKDLQRHPSTSSILHADFQRISETEKLHMEIPLRFINEDRCPGIKESGGILSRQMNSVEIRCLPKDLPEFIEVDLSSLPLNGVVHLSDLKLPAEVELVALIQGEGRNPPVASVQLAREETEEAEKPIAEVPTDSKDKAAE